MVAISNVKVFCDFKWDIAVEHIGKPERKLCTLADILRLTSTLASSDYFFPLRSLNPFYATLPSPDNTDQSLQRQVRRVAVAALFLLMLLLLVQNVDP